MLQKCTRHLQDGQPQPLLRKACLKVGFYLLKQMSWTKSQHLHQPFHTGDHETPHNQESTQNCQSGSPKTKSWQQQNNQSFLLKCTTPAPSSRLGTERQLLGSLEAKGELGQLVTQWETRHHKIMYQKSFSDLATTRPRNTINCYPYATKPDLTSLRNQHRKIN